MSFGSVKVESITRKGRSAPLAILYFHGGGFVIPITWVHRRFASILAQKLHVTCYLVDYSLLPKEPFPKALDECLEVYKALLSLDLPASRIVFMGDSAGGNLALSTLIALRNNKEDLPLGAILLSSWTDLTLSGNSLYSKKEIDPIVPVHTLPKVVKAYGGGKVKAPHPLMSPLSADLRSLPPFLIQVGTHEVLLDDSLRLADKLTKAGVKVTLEVRKDMYHIHPVLFPALRESQNALISIEKFISELAV